MFQRTISRAQTGRVFVQLLPPRKPRENVVDRVLIGMKISNMATDILLGRIAKEIELGPVSVNDCAVSPDEMQRQRAVLEEIRKIRLGNFISTQPSRGSIDQPFASAVQRRE